MELMLMIEPPPVFAICSAASFVPRNTLVWLTAVMRCQPSSPSVSPTELLEMPALLTEADVMCTKYFDQAFVLRAVLVNRTELVATGPECGTRGVFERGDRG